MGDHQLIDVVVACQINVTPQQRLGDQIRSRRHEEGTHHHAQERTGMNLEKRIKCHVGVHTPQKDVLLVPRNKAGPERRS